MSENLSSRDVVGKLGKSSLLFSIVCINTRLQNIFHIRTKTASSGSYVLSFLFSTLFNCQLAVSSWVFLELQQVYRPYCYFVSALTFLWGLPCIAFSVFGWYSKEGSKKWAGKTMQQILHIVWRDRGSWGDLRCVLDGSSVEKSPPIPPK